MVIDEIIEYLQAKIADDESLPDIKVLEAYTYAHKVKTTEVQVQFTQHSEYSAFTTFEGVEVSVCPLVINVYATQTVIDEVTYSAQRMSYMLAQKIVQWLDYAEMPSIQGVIGVQNAKYIPGVPFDTGTLIYQSVVRADLYIEKF